VDPKGKDWDKYSGATWITPNFDEFSAIIGKTIHNRDSDIEDNISFVAKTFGIENVLVTRSEQGMSLYNGASVFHIPAHAKEVYDVSGAGDTVVAVLAAMLGIGIEPLEACKIANIAAGIVVRKAGTATVSRLELETVFRRKVLDPISSKIMDWDTLFALVGLWKKNGDTVAVANGCFDIFHRGHASLIHSASKLCTHLIVAINADATVQKLKGADRPINKEYDRAYILASLEGVDAVVVFSEDTPEKLLSFIKPDILVKGAEYTLEQVPGRQYAKKVELLDYIAGYSTTSIEKKVQMKK
jgi:D-beta-D-heptose 7-phosphate kinase/D-beta-D-heptose 1-phosphate adenosyltransferase